MGIVLADDLTSAAEAAGQFAAAGGRARIMFEPGQVAPGVTACLDLDTRAVEPSLAVARCVNAVRMLLPHATAADPLLYKTMDSSLRGNWAVELDATMRAADRPVAIVAPAYPAHRRVTVDGVQYADHLPVDKGPAGSDPVTPVTDAALRPRLTAVGLSAGLARPDLDLRTAVARFVDDPGSPPAHGRVLVVDARTDADLALLAAAVDPYLGALVLCGSPGLWEALHPSPPQSPGRQLVIPGARADRVLVVVGSLHPTTRAQLAWLAASGVPVHPVDPTADTDAMAKQVSADFDTGRAVVAVSTADQLGSSGAALARLADVAVLCATRSPGLGLVLTGGDTARTVALALGASAIDALGIVAPGIPVGRLTGPRPHPIICKAGGFGTGGTLRLCVRILTGRNE